VMLPPGLARLETKSCATGSETNVNTTGIVLVARPIDVKFSEETARITSGVSPTSSTA